MLCHVMSCYVIFKKRFCSSYLSTQSQTITTYNVMQFKPIHMYYIIYICTINIYYIYLHPTCITKNIQLISGKFIEKFYKEFLLKLAKHLKSGHPFLFGTRPSSAGMGMRRVLCYVYACYCYMLWYGMVLLLVSGDISQEIESVYV